MGSPSSSSSRSAASMLTMEDIQIFHETDRQIYSRLVVDLRRDLLQSMEVIALWMWLQDIGYPNLILKMVDLSNDILNEVADEAVLCSVTIAANIPPLPPSHNFTRLHMTNTLFDEGQHINLTYFHENRERAIAQILRITNGVCKIAFQDIVQQVLSSSASNVNLFWPGSGSNPEAFSAPPIQRLGHSQFSSLSIVSSVGPASGVYLGVGGITFEIGDSSTSPALNPLAEPYYPTRTSQVAATDNNEIMADSEELILEDERTLFVTFSRGYPIPKQDVHDFFVRTFGRCVEEIFMQEVAANEQPMFARIVLFSPSQIGDILQGRKRVKFSVNGRHIVVRRYETRRPSLP